MYELARMTENQIADCGTRIAAMGRDAATMEDAANEIVRALYNELTDGPDGDKACALVRFYKTHPYAGLDATLRGFANAKRILRFVWHQVHVDLRDFVKPQDWVVYPVPAAYSRLRKPDLLFQGPARGLDDSPFNLRAHTIRVDDEAGVANRGCMLQPDVPVSGIYVKPKNDTDVTRQILEAGETRAPALATCRCRTVQPTTLIGQSLQHRPGPFIVKMPDAKFQRILSA